MAPPLERVLFAVKLQRKTEVLIEDMFLSLVGTTRPAMGYHVSILGPAVIANNADFARGLARASAILDEHLPIPTTLCSIGAFQNGEISTPYLSIENPAPYYSLHKALLSIFAGAIEPESERYRRWTIDQYMPHVTLSLGLSPAEMKAFEQRTGPIKLNVHFEAQYLSLLRQAPAGPWKLDQDLGKEDGGW